MSDLDFVHTWGLTHKNIRMRLWTGLNWLKCDLPKTVIKLGVIQSCEFLNWVTNKFWRKALKHIDTVWDFRFSRRREWSSEFSGMYCSQIDVDIDLRTRQCIPEASKLPVDTGLWNKVTEPTLKGKNAVTIISLILNFLVVWYWLSSTE
jgi:hypothetical protein